ncbi:MAG: Na/Pi cotransporter family protein [Lachnospiraceae bacterium]|nr:Na/Pi cotransporter family protein [Lachnospiraceae bacterium]
MDIFGVLSLVGGLALFLYGMNAMGDGLTKLSGGKLEKLLERLTSNRLMAVLLGAGVTAVIQSSSATTVMAVGFVNSGIMKLSQAVGIIMGANIGTTITSWILSLTGIESGNIFIKMLNPSSFSPILAVIGIGLLLFSKSDKKKTTGTLLCGFAILMFGMKTMSDAVAPLADVPEFTNILTKFSNPLLGVLAGAILTAIIQSSSASIGILQALCVTGSISYAAAIPIIMGQNIGTCITALLSAVGSNTNGKRTAMVHLYFNLIGTVVFMGVFYLLNSFLHFGFMGDAAIAAGIAIVHSGFNIFATVVLFPFANNLEKLACLSIPAAAVDTPVDEANQMLDIRFLETPSIALEQAKKVAVQMAHLTQDGITAALQLFKTYRKEDAETVVNLEGRVDHYEDALGTYLVKISSKNLTDRDSQTLSMLLHCIGDFERISDHSMNILQSAKEMHEKGLSFSSTAYAELKVYRKAVTDILNLTVNVFEKEDLEEAGKVEPLEEIIDNLNAQIKDRHVLRLQQGRCTIELGFILLDLLTDFERVSDHCSNIAVCVSQIHSGAFDTHEYLQQIKNGSNADFEAQYLSLQAQYLLPENIQEPAEEKNDNKKSLKKDKKKSKKKEQEKA